MFDHGATADWVKRFAWKTARGHPRGNNANNFHLGILCNAISRLGEEGIMLGTRLKPATLAALWCVVVTACYYVYNYAYYKEKVSVFGRYLLNFLG